MIRNSISYFIDQNYSYKELVIIDDGNTFLKDKIQTHRNVLYFHLNETASNASKRNFGIEQSQGEIIMHWDEQDTYSYDWVTHQVTSLLSLGADASGLDKFIVQKNNTERTLMVKDPINTEGWLYSATLVY